MLRPQVFALAGGRGFDRADLLGETGHRRHVGQPGRRRPAIHARGRHLLERPRRKLHRRRGVPADRFAQQRQRHAQPLAVQPTSSASPVFATAPGQIALQSVAFRPSASARADEDVAAIGTMPRATRTPTGLFAYLRDRLPAMTYDRLRWFADELAGRRPKRPRPWASSADAGHRSPLSDGRQETQLRADHSSRRLGDRYSNGSRCAAKPAAGTTHLRINWSTRDRLRGPQGDETTLADRRSRLPARRRGLRCDAGGQGLSPRLAAASCISTRRGTRFHGVGFGPAHEGLADRLLRQPGRLSRLRHRRLGDLRPRQRPGPTLPDQQARANWSSTATWARRSSTAPRGARCT